MAGLPDLPGLTARISADLAAAGIRHAVSGAMAMAAHGVVRATLDIDLLVAVPDVRLPEVFQIVRSHGLEGDDRDLLKALRENHFAELRSGPVGVELLVPVLPYHATLVDRAVSLEVAGKRVPFVTLEDLVILKLLWHRTKDIADVQSLLAAAKRPDVAYLTSTLESILPAGDPRHAELRALVRRL